MTKENKENIVIPEMRDSYNFYDELGERSRAENAGFLSTLSLMELIVKDPGLNSEDRIQLLRQWQWYFNNTNLVAVIAGLAYKAVVDEFTDRQKGQTLREIEGILEGRITYYD